MSRVDIKNLIIAELQTTAEKAIFDELKAYLLSSITNPGVQLTVVYNFTNGPLTQESMDVLKLLIFAEWGLVFYISEMYVLIDLIKFLE